jgi:hypothetical protein
MFGTLTVGVTEKPPFALTAKMDAPTGVPGKPITATITATRQAGFTAEIVLAIQGLPPGVKAPVVKIAAMQTTVQATLMLPPNAKIGQSLLTFQGSAKHNGRDFVVRTGPVTLVIKK